MFGFGKKKAVQPAAPQGQQQLSPEAMAILQQMQAQAQGQEQGQAPANPQGQHPQAQPQMPAGMAAGIPQQMPTGQMPQQMPAGQPAQPAMPGDQQQALLAALQAAPNQGIMQPMNSPPEQQMQAGQMPQQMPGQMPAGQMPVSPMMAAPQMGDPAAATGPAQPAMPNSMPNAVPGLMQGITSLDVGGAGLAPAKTKKELKKEQAAAKRAEKDKKAKQAAEEKSRKKRRKQLSKSRFSRARYLREAGGNQIASVVLWLFMLIILISGSISLVNLYLAPITATNQQTIREIDQLQATIRNSQPQIQQTLETRRERESEIQLLASTLPSSEQVQAQLDQFISRLKASDIRLDDENIQTVDLGSGSILGIQFTANITTTYLEWLRERNRFMRRQAFARVPVEKITASPDSTEILVELTLVLPAAK